MFFSKRFANTKLSNNKEKVYIFCWDPDDLMWYRANTGFCGKRYTYFTAAEVIAKHPDSILKDPQNHGVVTDFEDIAARGY